MHTCRHQRQEEYDKYLRVYRASDFLVTHPYVLHYFETRLILAAFRKLLVIHDQHCGHDEKQPQEYADEKQPRKIHTVAFRLDGAAFQVAGEAVCIIALGLRQSGNLLRCAVVCLSQGITVLIGILKNVQHIMMPDI